ncbi:MAG: adenine phosphoribosyltransferase [Nocardioidaceae bacterium]|nr:adenine phosphoribosyltransferase [Nocardioidaceae bacterium]
MSRQEVRVGAAEALTRLVRDIPDFPDRGVLFKDVTPVLADGPALAAVTAALADIGRNEAGETVVDAVVGMEARGFILGAPVALALGVGFVPVRKSGKLPHRTHQVAYALEYGEAMLEIHCDALTAGQRVLVIDDVLATGGTARATCELVRRCGAEPVGFGVLLELGFLAGRGVLGDLPVTALSTV